MRFIVRLVLPLVFVVVQVTPKLWPSVAVGDIETEVTARSPGGGSVTVVTVFEAPEQAFS